MKMKREKKEKRKNKETGKKRKRQKLIHTDKHTDIQTDRRTDVWTDRHKSFIGMRYYTEQYSKSNSIKQNIIKSNGDQISRRDKTKEHEI